MTKPGFIPMIATACLMLGAPVWANGDAAQGEKVFKKCVACHTVGEGQPSRMGPNLHNVFGRKVGTLEGFSFSPTYKAAGEAGDVWTPERFTDFIAQPRAMYGGGRMVLQIADEGDRTDLLAFLMQHSPAFEAE